MPEGNETVSQSNQNSSKKKMISNSSILRVVILGVCLSLYYILLSPSIETSLNKNLGNLIRSHSKEQINVLSPIFDINVYAGEYDLGTTGSNSSIKSKTNIQTVDPRIIAMNKFLINYNSPMASYAESFIVEADKYGLDWRLVASISGVESAFGNITPTDTNNGWGWRGGPGGDWSQFETWADGIAEVTRGLGEGYGIHMTPFDIEPIYCPPCGRNPEHAWANGVTRFMNQLDYYLDNLETL